MNTKKVLGYGLIAVMIALAFTVCEEPETSTTTTTAHEHQWGLWNVTTPATCTTTGSQTRTCALDPTHKETQEIAIDPNAHSYTTYNVTTNPTCLLEGEEQAVCTRDNTHAKGIRSVTALGHDWDFVNAVETVVPTCTTKGSGTASCKREGCEETNTGTNNIPALGHDYQTYTETTAPTCTTAGTKTGTCTYNGSHTTTQPVDINPNAHNYQNYSQTTAPTCSAKGIDTGTCTYNSSHKDTREGADINPNAHNFAVGAYLCSGCNNPYELGDTGPGGGKIFYRTATGFTVQMVNSAQNYTAHYLEVAFSSSSYAWASSSYTTTYISTTSYDIGTGRRNTARILATDTYAPAAKYCNDYSGGGKTDWFLPSRYELNQLYENRTSVGNIWEDNYWSSSEGNSGNYAWRHNFYNNTVEQTIKNGTNFARPVRAF